MQIVRIVRATSVRKAANIRAATMDPTKSANPTTNTTEDAAKFSLALSLSRRSHTVCAYRSAGRGITLTRQSDERTGREFAASNCRPLCLFRVRNAESSINCGRFLATR